MKQSQQLLFNLDSSNLIREYFVYKWGRSVWGISPVLAVHAGGIAPYFIIALDLPVSLFG